MMIERIILNIEDDFVYVVPSLPMSAIDDRLPIHDRETKNQNMNSLSILLFIFLDNFPSLE